MKESVERIFHAVADLSADARAGYYAQHGIDSVTQKEVDELLAFDSDDSIALKANIRVAAERTLGGLDHKGLRCGPYRLGEMLGRGGMGAVYLAERVDGELDQKVAVKLLRPGTDEPFLRQRFLAERQILARLSHPNIARLLDAGHLEDGQPYLVMEYVPGKDIDVYTNGLSISQKVRLFCKVGEAVGYLHQNLVVHRDLKPANILVTSTGDVKLLDFGIAKLVDLTGDVTLTGMQMLSPGYASPEQMAGGAVSTATDVYSLGAVLYKVLTGSSPHQLRNESLGALARAVSEGRITPPSKLVPALKGDLEMILMKAMRKEPQERYLTVEQFSDDLKSYLGSRPIRTRQGDVWYRTRKFAKRYWLPLAAAALAIGSLSVGVAVANRGRALAQRRFTEVRQLANKLFAIDHEASKLPNSTKTRQLIVDTSLEYLKRLSVDAQTDPELALDVANAYVQVARVQGVPLPANLGQVDQAHASLHAAEILVEPILRAHPSNRVAIYRSAEIAHDQMLLARSRLQDAEALRLAHRCVELLEKFHATVADKADASGILRLYLNVIEQHIYGRHIEEAIPLMRPATEFAVAVDSNSAIAQLRFLSSEINSRRGDLDRALADVREAERLMSQGGPDVAKTLGFSQALINEGDLLGGGPGSYNLGRPGDALVPLRKAFSMLDELAHKDLRDKSSRGRLAAAGVSIGEILESSDPGHALEIYDHVIQHTSEIQGNSNLDRLEIEALAGASYALRRLGRPGEARQRVDKALAKLRAIGDYPTEKLKPGYAASIALNALADLEAAAGNTRQAIALYQSVLDKTMAWGADLDTNLQDSTEVSRLYAGLAALHRRAGDTAAASSFEDKRLALWRYWDARLPNNTFVRRQLASPPAVIE